MARPLASADLTCRDVKITVRVTKQERSKLKENASLCGLSATEFIMLKCVYEDQEFVVIDDGELTAIKVELRRQGNNLNQIAAALNSLKFNNKITQKTEKLEAALGKIDKIFAANAELYGLVRELSERAHVQRRM